jgi:peptide/nickel transport system permease protein
MSVADTVQASGQAGLPKRRSRILRAFRGNRAAVVGLFVVVLVVIMAVFAPWLAPQQPDKVNLRMRMKPPSSAYVLGTDEVGRDLLSRVIWGSRVSLMVGVVSVAIASVAGVALGLVAGYFGKTTDRVIMGLMDIMLSFPLLLLSMVLVAILGQSLLNIMLAVGISSVPQYARLVRSSVLSIREREFVQAGVALGSSHRRILWKHILPNVLTPIVVMATIRVASAILIEASLSFLGLGDPTQPTWGSIVAAGRPYIQNAPWISTFGGLAITVTVLGLNMLGDGLRDALDPRLRRVAS